MIPVYPVLAGEIAKRGYKKVDIAGAINISPRALYCKMVGATDFTLSEAMTIYKQFFPDIQPTDLFSRSDSVTA